MLRPLGRLGMALLLGVQIAWPLGCGSSRYAGQLRVESASRDPVLLKGNFRTANFSDDGKGVVSFMLSSVPIDDVLNGTVRTGQILHIEMLWVPKAGMTPIEDTATNASVRLLVIADGRMGLYGGAGFAMPSNDLTDDSVTITIRDASLRLLNATEGFDDLLGSAQLTGSFDAKRDDRKTRQLNLAASQMLTNALGFARYVDVSGSDRQKNQRPQERPLDAGS